MAIYSFDQNGTNPSNLIQNEIKTVASVNGVNLNYIVPDNAPFFGHSLVVVDTATSRELREGVDYVFTHKFQEAFNVLAKDVYGSFSFLDPNRTGEFLLRYQTMGGDFVTTSTQAITNGMGTLVDLTSKDWTELSGVPPTFPPTFHTQPLSDMDAVTGFLSIMAEIRDALTDQFNSLTLSDITDLDTGFIQPLLNEMGNLRGALLGRSFEQSFKYNQDVLPGTSNINLGAITPGSWKDTGLSVIVPVDGSYKVDCLVPNNPIRTASESALVRFVIDDLPVTESQTPGAVISLAAGTSVKMEVSATGSVADFFISVIGMGSSLTITRLGN